MTLLANTRYIWELSDVPASWWSDHITNGGILNVLQENPYDKTLSIILFAFVLNNMSPFVILCVKFLIVQMRRYYKK